MKRTILLVLVLFLVVPMMTVQAASSYYETEVERGVNFRAAPSLSGYKFRMIPRGEDIHVIQQLNSSWLQIQVQDGTTGFISANSQYTDYNTSPSNGTADRIIAHAKSLMGRVTYNFGTRNPGQLIFDCSSFTQYVFGQQGITLQWGTKYQQYAGNYVSKSNLQRGDLVFFWTRSPNIVNHVGIYIGSGQFIHNSPANNGVDIDNLNAGYWQDHYIKARRVL